MIYLLAGHHLADPGAVSGGVKESDLTIELRNLVVPYLVQSGLQYKVDDDRNTLSQVIAKIDSTEKCVILDLHWNAASSNQANGLEVVIPERSTDNERFYGDLLAKEGSKALGIRNRGVIPESRTARKSLAIMRPHGMNLLLEVCFITNPKDMAAYQRNKHTLAKVIASVLYQAEIAM